MEIPPPQDHDEGNLQSELQGVAGMLDILCEVEAQSRPRKPGQEVGPNREFLLLERIGAGGMGEVWKVKHKSMDRICAIKFPNPKVLQAEAAQSRPKYEAQILAQLRHPNIIVIHQLEHSGDELFFVMDYVQGDDLARRIKKGEFFSAKDSKAEALQKQRSWVMLMERVADATAKAFSSGVIHRDIKPANILVEIDGTPYLTDFGIASGLGAPASIHPDSRPEGTLQYIAPERFTPESPVATHQADVWSFGVVIYELLTGALPFDAQETGLCLARIQEGRFVHPSVLNRWADKDLAAVCMKCLQLNPEDRYQTAAEIRADFQNWLQGRPVRARTIGLPRRVLKWAMRNPMAAALAASVVLGPSMTAMTYVLILPYITNTHSVRAFQDQALDLDIVAEKGERCSCNIRKDPLREGGGRWAVLNLHGETNGLPPRMRFLMLADQGGLPDPSRTREIEPGVPFKVRPGVWLGDYLDRYYYLGAANWNPKTVLEGRTQLKARITLVKEPPLLTNPQSAATTQSRSTAYSAALEH